MAAGPYERLTVITPHDHREATGLANPYERLTAITSHPPMARGTVGEVVRVNRGRWSPQRG